MLLLGSSVFFDLSALADILSLDESFSRNPSMRIVAFGFDEYTAMQMITGKILKELVELPVEVKAPQIVFGWTNGRLGIGVNTGEKTNVKKVHYADTPVGMSVNEWATMVYREINNYLLPGSRFAIQELMGGNLDEKYFILPLARI